MKLLFNLLFGCSCTHLSRVFTIEGNTYKVCLTCGKEIPYDWQEMKEVA